MEVYHPASVLIVKNSSGNVDMPGNILKDYLRIHEVTNALAECDDIMVIGI